MNTQSILILAAIVAVVVVATYLWHHSKHHIAYSDRQLADIVGAIFAEARTDHMSADAFLHTMKHRVSCTHKDLLYLYGKCQQLGLITTEGGSVRKA